MSYRVDISPDAKQELMTYLQVATDEFGEDTVNEILDELDYCIALLEENPYVGFKKIKMIPDKYKLVYLWKHYWFIYQIYETEKSVKIEYCIDDRQNYGTFVH